MSRPPSDLYAVPDLYDAQYRTYRDDLGFYRRLVEDVGGPVLEVGCGTGRVTVELARTGADVTAVDVSPAMLRRAREQAKRVNMTGRVDFREADMRELGETLPPKQRFVVAIAPFNTLMHAYTLEDQDRTLRGVYERLEPGGIFACDVYVPRFGAPSVLRLEPVLQPRLGPGVDLILVQDHDPAGQRIVSTYLVDTTDGDGVVRRQRVELVQRYFTRFELERAVRQAGFERVQVFGSFDRAPFRDESDVIVVLARKPRA